MRDGDRHGPGALAFRTPPLRGERRDAIVIAALLLASVSSCGAEPISSDGQIGRPMNLASGDVSVLPRLAFVDGPCPGPTGGCDSVSDGGCQMLLVDSLSPLTAIRDPDVAGATLDDAACLEVRPAAGLAAPDPTAEDRAAAVARFRFDHLPVVRAPDGDQWSWTAGDQVLAIEPGGVMGGNLLRNFAVAIRRPVPPAPGLEPEASTLTLYGEFPGSERNLADQGRAFLPLQFPGRLLGRELTDRCEVDVGRCELDGFDISTSAAEIPLAPSRMVMDACLAIPPCGLRYSPSSADPFGQGVCSSTPGPDVDPNARNGVDTCDDATDPELGGFSASLVVATGVTGLVLFSDSAQRMFGELSAIEPCPAQLSPNTEVDPGLRVCLLGNDGVLHFAGWPSAGLDAPLPQLRVRSVGLVAGAARSRAAGPCARAQTRRDAMLSQCDRYRRAARISPSEVDIRNAAPPYSATRDDDDGDDHAGDPSSSSLAVLGEAQLANGALGPRPARWVRATILPADHPLALAVRRDVSPEALEPDGLLGAGLLIGTETVLDYTDLNPAVRISCLQPHEGRCMVLPDCSEDRQRACCHGLPRSLLDEIIRPLGNEICCGALSAEDLAELQEGGHCVGTAPP